MVTQEYLDIPSQLVGGAHVLSESSLESMTWFLYRSELADLVKKKCQIVWASSGSFSAMRTSYKVLKYTGTIYSSRSIDAAWFGEGILDGGSSRKVIRCDRDDTSSPSGNTILWRGGMLLLHPKPRLESWYLIFLWILC